MIAYTVMPYAYKQIGDTDEYEVAWYESDGNCFCSKIPRRGMVTVNGGDAGYVEIERAIRKKYYGDDSGSE